MDYKKLGYTEEKNKAINYMVEEKKAEIEKKGVTFCIDCKHSFQYGREENTIIVCGNDSGIKGIVCEWDYCSNGERKEK